VSIADEPSLILNLGGEGELVGAVDINNLVVPMRRPATWIRPGHFIQGDMTALPVRSDVAFEVQGNKLPMMSDGDRALVASEARRVLRPGGRVRLWASSGGGDPWVNPLEADGFTEVTIEGLYAIGVAP
jgi:hypothetical protein